MSPEHHLYQATPRWQAELTPNLHVLHALILYVKREVACVISCLPCDIDYDNVNIILWMYYFVSIIFTINYIQMNPFCLHNSYSSCFVCFASFASYYTFSTQRWRKKTELGGKTTRSFFSFSGILIFLHSHYQFQLLTPMHFAQLYHYIWEIIICAINWIVVQ